MLRVLTHPYVNFEILGPVFLFIYSYFVHTWLKFFNILCVFLHKELHIANLLNTQFLDHETMRAEIQQSVTKSKIKSDDLLFMRIFNKFSNENS